MLIILHQIIAACSNLCHSCGDSCTQEEIEFEMTHNIYCTNWFSDELMCIISVILMYTFFTLYIHVSKIKFIKSSF